MAPVTGKYILCVRLLIAALDHDAATHAYVKIVTSNRSHGSYYDIQAMWQAQAELHPFQMECVADMDASDTAHVTYNSVGPGADQEDVYGTDPKDVSFSGTLVG